ncbi:hypothetical protein P378_17160 [Desulforamulus profundi]|uniref:Uncharacterized protein n=1 Tax=Desulforamulus profundi TaxID=1383067 RepID=A0A2C6M869_9FIRM|nr:hypothetical protein P378_17160 [Desulforamulus profundi]
MVLDGILWEQGCQATPGLPPNHYYFFERDLGVEKVTKFFTSLPAFSGRRMLQTARQTHQTPFVLQDPSSFDFLILNITYQKKSNGYFL